MSKKTDPKVAEAVMLKAGLQPLEPYKNSRSNWKCKCLKCGDVVSPKYGSIKSGHGGCGICARNIPDLKNILQVMKNARFKPLEPYKTALTKWKCKCLVCKNIVYPKYNTIQQGKGGCDTCGTVKRTITMTMSKEKAVAMMLKAKLQPLVPYKNSQTRWKSKCLRCKKITQPTLSSIQQGHIGCLTCGFKITADKLKKDEKAAVAVMLKQGYITLEPYKSSNTLWRCKCVTCGKISKPTFGSVQYGKGICVYCSGNKVDPQDAKKIMLKAKLKPLELYVDNKKRWKCQCLKCGEIVTPTFNAIRNGQGGCIYCAKMGFNAKIPSYLYLITNKELGAHKVGIGNVRPKSKPHLDRKEKFKKYGWEIYKVWDFKTGGRAWKIETDVFQVIRKDLKLPIYLSKEQMPKTGGHAETVDADSISLVGLEKIINRVIKEQVD